MTDTTPEEGYRNALEKIEEAARIGATSLDLKGLGLLILPPEIGLLKELKNLDLGEISDWEVGDWSLSLGGREHDWVTKSNHLTSLPVEIGQLTALTSLDLTGNKFTSLPDVIGQFPNLTSLTLTGNSLISLSANIGTLTNLTSLFLSNNQLTTLPPEIGLLKELTTLSLGELRSRDPDYDDPTKESGEYRQHQYKNFISQLPSEIGKCLNLNNLNLLNNNLSDLPPQMLQLTNLKRLDLRGNHLPIPPEIIEKTNEPQTILNYYFSITKNKETSIPTKNVAGIARVNDFAIRHLNEVKILFLGQGAVGKTSILQRILHGTFDQNQTKTEGISINQWQVQGSQNRETEGQSQSEIENRKSEIKLNIWDFGGQEIMHATHQFFLTKRSLYILVLDARLTQEENRVEYWLKIIQSFGGESPMLIVGNKTDQHPLDIDRTGLQKKYPNIVGILETSAATGAGIEALKTTIAEQVDTLPHVRDLLPETWFTVKSKLEELGRDKNFITQDEYLAMCGANDVTDETSQHTLIGFLHDLGVVLHFQDDPRLEALGILNPQWVTNGVYKILNSHELFQNQGTLTLPILNKTLNPPEYPSNKRLFIVDMMKKFELCYEIPYGYDVEPNISFLIPDLLPKDEPFTGEWDGALAFQYHYNVLPSSIISRFIVRMNAFVHKTIWRSGVVLKSGGNTALVKADTEDRKIYIWVAGDMPTRREFLAVIRAEFAAIHKTIAKIEATEKVPLPNAPEADPVDLTFLQRLASEGRESLPVQVGDRIIDLIVKEVLSKIETQNKTEIHIHGSVSDSNLNVGDHNQLDINSKKKPGKKKS